MVWFTGLSGCGKSTVANVVNRELDPGTHSVVYDASALRSGVYMYTLEAEGRKICVELLQELAQIKGVAGAHMMGPRQEQTIAEAITESGLLKRRAKA